MCSRNRASARCSNGLRCRARASLSAQPLPLQQQCVLGGGDDYELLFSAPASARAAVQRAAAQAEVAVSRIGEIQG